MRRREGLVQVDVHHVEAHVAWTTSAQHRVQISAIIVHQAATVVDKFRNLGNTRLEKSEGIGIGHHHGSDVGTFLFDKSY